MRDLRSIYSKLVQVLYPIRSGSGREVLKFVAYSSISVVTRSLTFSLRDWDLWGPLLLCLTLALMLSYNVLISFR